MALELASNKIGRRIDVLREEIASLRNVESVSLPEILKIDPASSYTVWVDGAKKARRFFANRKERKDSRAGTKIVQIMNSEFKTPTRWRQLMNRLAADQVSDQISSIKNLNGEKAMVVAVRKMAITQAKLVGSPDAEELVDFLFREEAQFGKAGINEINQEETSGSSEISEISEIKEFEVTR